MTLLLLNMELYEAEEEEEDHESQEAQFDRVSFTSSDVLPMLERG